MNTPVVDAAVCSFNRRFLYKFGGYSLSSQGRKVINTTIEQYDVNYDKWTLIDPTINSPMNQRVLMTHCACAVQINRHEIMVFGGYLETSKGVNSAFVFRIMSNPAERSGGKNAAYYAGGTAHEITEINTKMLPYPEGFFNDQAIIYKNRLIALQNVSSHLRNDEVLADKRTILIFNSHEWNYLT